MPRLETQGIVIFGVLKILLGNSPLLLFIGIFIILLILPFFLFSYLSFLLTPFAGFLYLFNAEIIVYIVFILYTEA